MLNQQNIDILITIAENADSSPISRISACSLLYKLSAMSAKHIIEILQETVDDAHSKSSAKIKAMELMDKINESTGQEPELRSEDEELVKTQLMEKYLVCPRS